MLDLKKSRPLSSFRVGNVIRVSDQIQNGYSYQLVEPVGKNFHPDFQPQLTPAEMLKLGVFEGKYINDCMSEFPCEWYQTALKAGKLSLAADEKLNCFGVKSRQPLSEWIRKGWITPDDPDPRGWFQWYCRYYLGRRDENLDLRQIKRWRAFHRHAAQVQKNCAPGDLHCRPRQRQALLQWAYDPFI